MKTAILQCADTGPLESLVVMLRSAGYQCYIPDTTLKAQLRRLGCDCVYDIESQMKSEGVEAPFDIPCIGPEGMKTCDLYVDVKAQRNAERVWSRWPRLKGRTLWYRINGGEPTESFRKGVSQGNEIDPVCPILTPNLWYRLPGKPWSDKAYACYPPFYRFNSYWNLNGRPTHPVYSDPITLVHNLSGWGHGGFAEGVKQLGVKVYGNGSPDGLIQHSRIPGHLSTALAMVHLKSNDAPGYAIYECLAAACPILVSKRLLDKCLMTDLLEPDVTCLTFDDEYPPEQLHWAHTPEVIEKAVAKIGRHLEYLRNVENNRRIGLAGHHRLKQLMWNEELDGLWFYQWMQRMFP